MARCERCGPLLIGGALCANCVGVVEPSTVASAASAGLFLAVLARLAENGYAHEVKRCVDVCKDARANTQLWERVVDLPLRVTKGNDFWGAMPRLAYWAGKGDLVRVRETLDRGARVDERNSMGATALMRAALFARPVTARELVARGADVNARDSRGETPLMWSCCGVGATNGTAVSELLRLGADVNACNERGSTALYLAATLGNVGAVRVLLAAPGVDPDARTHGMSPFEAVADRFDDFNERMALGVDDDYDDEFTHYSPDDALEIMQLLEDAGADVEYGTDDSESGWDSSGSG